MNTYNTKLNTKKIAVCGVLSAAAVVVMFLASLVGIGIYAGPYIAAFAVCIIRKEYGTKAALAAYTATAVIALLLMPDRELALFYVFFGWYPAVLPLIRKIRPRLLKIFIELAIYCAMIFLMYGIVMKLLGLDGDMAGESKVFIFAIAAIGGLAFLITDPAYKKVSLAWEKKYRKFLH